MNKALLELLQNHTGSLTIEQIFSNFVAAVILAACIYLSYRMSHSSAVYSPRFNASLVMVALITTMVMTVIGNNIALSLGMVGALSIVRFRTAIKDPRDTTYIFWAIGCGLCCGVSEYYVGAIGTGVLFVVMVLFGTIRNNDRYLLVIHANEQGGKDAEKAVHNIYEGRAALRVHNASRNNAELIYELSYRMIRKKLPDRKTVNEVLMEIEGVRQANLIMQSEEVSR